MVKSKKLSNEIERDIVQEYSDTLSKIGQELFSDFLSDNTRLRQTYLLITSVIAILLAYTLITPVQSADIGGATFNFTNPDIPKLLAGAICLYFSMVYLICVLQDYEVYKFKTQPGFQIVRAKLNQLLDTMAEAKPINSKKRTNSRTSLEIILRKHESLIAKFDAQISTLEKETSSLKSAAITSQDTTRAISRLESQLRTVRATKKAKIEDHNELMRSLQEQESESDQRGDANIVLTAKEKVASLNSVFTKYRTYNAGIVIIEVLFPLALAAFALISTWSSLFGK